MVFVVTPNPWVGIRGNDSPQDWIREATVAYPLVKNACVVDLLRMIPLMVGAQCNQPFLHEKAVGQDAA
jgi:hypothetical protein